MKEIINEAEVWFIDNGILPSSVQYNLYTQKEALKYPQSTAILGVGKNRQGQHIGFAIEVIMGKGVVYGSIIEPDGIAMQGKKGLMRTISDNIPLVDAMQKIAQEHRTTFEYYERISGEKGISLMEAMKQYPLPQYQQPQPTPKTISQKPPKPQPTKLATHQSTENDDETDDEVENIGNQILYNLLWTIWGIGIISQFFIKDTYNFSGSTVLFIWLIGFVIAVTSIMLKREKFFTLVHIGFMLFVPFSFAFWLSVFYGLMYGGDEPKLTTNTQTNITLNQVIDDIQSKGVENMHQTKTHQNIVEQTQQYLGSNPSDEKLQAYLQKIVDDTNPNLPIMVEQNVRADSMHRFGKILMHYFTITDIQSSIGTNFDQNTVNELKIELMNSANICKNNGHILKYGVSLSFSYYAINKDKLFDVLITPQDCGY